MHIAVVGGGPAGCRASQLLAESGHQVTLLDAQGPWEKPCGGGVTAKALDLVGTVPPDLPRRTIETITVYFGDGLSVELAPSEPLVVVSRKELGIHLLRAAEAAGVRFLRGRASGLTPNGSGWTLRTRDAALDVDFVVGADGATSFVRRQVGTPLTSEELNVTLGYFIPGETSSDMKVFFLPTLSGYIWSFPRPDHVSYGLITRPDPGWTSRYKTILANFIEADLGEEAFSQAEFYSAPVPGLGPQSWSENRIAGPGWALVGDAAGLVDPITGEGIYYALRSAELLAGTLPSSSDYADAVSAVCVPELQRSSRMYTRFYSGRFAGVNFRKRLVQMARRSPAIRSILADLIAGSQPYVGLKRKLAWSIPRVAFDLLKSPFSG